jgi:predicted ATPase/class 3 adenylate cyclase
MAVQPTGTVTLLFSDIEGSTALLNELGSERYAQALELHGRLLREAFTRHCGYEVDNQGDSFFVAFSSATAAVEAAGEAQQALAGAEWPERLPVRVRMGIHTGEPLAAPPKYVGLDVHKAARVMAAGHGGQVLVSLATRDLLPEEVTLAGLGVHRLKDLLQPEPLYQLQVDGLRTEFPALKTLGNRPTNLPLVATPFIGREQELAVVQDLLSGDDVRVLTLTGPGGIGKTRLALQAAADASDRFHDGTYWVPFAAVRDPGLVAASVAHALGLREEPSESADETLGRFLNEKQLMLVLDNLEHLLESAREVIAAILRAAPGVRFMVTSREALRIRGEQLYEVPALTLQGSPDQPLEQVDAVQLFVSRAKAVDPTFALVAGNAIDVGEIVRRLEGLPLAIELAAARIRALPPAALVELLSGRLRLLTGGHHDADERQRTLRATIEWSYDLLTPEEQALFARLSVFIGGCRLDAARAVFDPEGVLDAEVADSIGSLIDKSLLRRRDDPDGQPRYWMLETIREYALSRLSGEEKEVCEKRVAEYMVVLAALAEPELRGQHAREWLLRLEADHDDLRASLDWLVARNRDAEVSKILAATWYFWVARGRLREVLSSARAALALSYSDPLQHAAVLANVGELLRHSGDNLAARPLKEQALVLFRAHSERRMEAALLLDLAEIAASQGELSRARQLRWESLSLREVLGDPVGIAHALTGIADDEVAAGDHDAARLTTLRILELAREVDDPEFRMYALYYLGELATEQDRLEEAATRFRDALGEAAAFGHVELTQAIVDGLARSFAATGEDRRASSLWGAAEAIRERSGSGFDFFPGASEARDRAIAAVKTRISGDVFAASWNAGRSLTVDELIAEFSCGGVGEADGPTAM